MSATIVTNHQFVLFAAAVTALLPIPATSMLDV
jgi:hypothetical protein